MEQITLKSNTHYAASIAKYDADLKIAKSHLESHFNNSVKLDDTEIDKWLQKAVTAENKVNFLRNHFVTRV